MGEQTLVWFHIPKTAGTSIVAEIGRFDLPWVHVVPGTYCSTRRVMVGDARDDLAAKRDEALRGSFRVMIGHMTQRDFFAAIGRFPRFRFATMLRDPVARVLSEYRYMTTSPEHPLQDMVLGRYPTFEHYVDELVDGNAMTHYLEEFRGEPVAAITRRLVEDFAFVGTLETYERDVARLVKLLGVPNVGGYKLNASPGPMPDLSPSVVRNIQTRNERDCELYSAFARLRQR